MREHRVSVLAPRRSKRAWTAVAFGLFMLILTLVFMLQNLNTVRVSFFWMHPSLPMAVLLLLVAVGGALIVFTFGETRILQLQRQARRLQANETERRRANDQDTGAGNQ